MTHVASAWRYAVLLLAAAPLIYYALATIAGLRFFKRVRSRVLPVYTPAVSVLKPVRGVDFGSSENFASFCRQEYPDYEILFAVNDYADPAVPLVHRVIAEFPKCKIRLLVGAEHLGANLKVNKLARLGREARNHVVVLTDGDVRVGPHFLREVVAPLAERKTGAVTSFYRGITEENIGAEIEAVGASSDFFAGVLMAEWTEGISFALGASIATTKEWLGKMGGLEAIADTLADDYELGNRIAKAGGEVVLSREVVWTMYPAQTCAGRGRCGCAGRCRMWAFSSHKACRGFYWLHSWPRRPGSQPAICSHTSSCVSRRPGRSGFGASETKSCDARFGWSRCGTRFTSSSGWRVLVRIASDGEPPNM